MTTRTRRNVASLRVFGVALLGAALIVLFWSRRWSGAPREAGLSAAVSRVVGYPGRVDALSLLPLAAELVEYRQLSRLIAVGVTRTGTLDLATGQYGARFEFYRSTDRRTNAAAKVVSAGHCGRQTVHLTREGLYSDPAMPEVSCAPFEPRGLPEPSCTLRHVWDRALKDGADPSFPAVIEYLFIEGQPAWRFSLLRQGLTKIYQADCSRQERFPSTGQ